ncbi:unnamed protein product [Boreogadus saida]
MGYMKPLLDVDVPSPPPGFPADPLERSPTRGRCQGGAFVFCVCKEAHSAVLLCGFFSSTSTDPYSAVDQDMMGDDAYRVSPGWLHTQAPDRERYSLTHCRLCGGKGEEVK